MADQRKNHTYRIRPKQKSRPEQLQTNNLPAEHMENINSTKKGRNLQLANKPQIAPWGRERMLQRIQRHSRFSLHGPAHPQREQHQTEKSKDVLDWLHKGIWHGPEKLDDKLPQNIPNIRWNHKLYREKPWKSGERNWYLVEGIFKEMQSPLLFIIAMMPLDQTPRKCTAG